ncbi:MULTISPECIES: ribonuclease D [unclassified Oceanobacter]|uniref:ribonuclease D n=1 Tax=unclassified Oceanobacter TaxID=2620260 RepID=UPI0026E36800|nr:MULTISPECIES: ribonuclease D [unclassified Oceanobacter]MDO6681558.1 ribonuclease D [Oceanobacter sp. 5_MG-2023]MDP2549242.1 ribonuclease D [Oceanobacter sp. 4_MG-2023]
MTSPQVPEPVWLTTNLQLAQACQDWMNEGFLALDTEFIRTSTFYPKAGLLQVADSQQCYLIDPLSVTEWQPLAEVFQTDTVTKVFHACAEDLEVCRQLTGVLPSPLADSQLAASMAGLGGSMGFQRLISALLDIDIDKEETRSNWLARPLSPDQIRYAVADVYFLRQIYPLLVEKLTRLGRMGWLEEDCQRIIDDQSQQDIPKDYYRRVKLAWKLRPQEQHILQELVGWRELQARERDVPRNKVVDDNSLWNIARFKPNNRDQLARAGLRPEMIRNDSQTLLAIVSQALEDDAALWPVALDRPLTPEAGQWLKNTREVVAKRAAELEIPPEILTRKKALDALIRSGWGNGQYVLPDVLQGWRKAEIGDTLLDMMTRADNRH